MDEEIRLFKLWKRSDKSLNEIEEKLAHVMNDSMGIYRDETDLKMALANLDSLTSDIDGSYYDHIGLEALILLAKACIMSALRRKESRGAHQRMDYPNSSDEYEKSTCITYDGEIHVDFE